MDKLFIRGRGGRGVASRARWWTIALLLVALAGVATGHGLLSLNVVVPPAETCPDGRERCLDLAEPQPALHGGDEVSLLAYNDANESHRILVTMNASADPTHENTSANAAIAATALVPANGSRDAGTFRVPSDASALYVWGGRPGHEAAGERLVVPVEASSEEGRWAPAGPVALAGLAASALLRALRDRA